MKPYNANVPAYTVNDERLLTMLLRRGRPAVMAGADRRCAAKLAKLGLVDYDQTNASLTPEGIEVAKHLELGGRPTRQVVRYSTHDEKVKPIRRDPNIETFGFIAPSLGRTG